MKNNVSNILSALIVLLGMFVSLSAQAEFSPSKKALSVSPNDPTLEWLDCPDFLPCTFTVLQGELGADNMDIFLKFPSQADVTFHTHSSAEHMIMIAGEFHTTYEGQDRAILKAGDYAYGPAGLAHDGYCASERECIMFVAYETALDAVPYDASNN